MYMNAIAYAYTCKQHVYIIGILYTYLCVLTYMPTIYAGMCVQHIQIPTNACII